MGDYKFKDPDFKKVYELLKKESATTRAALVKMQKNMNETLAGILKQINKTKK